MSLAEKYGATPAQILLNWGIQRGTVVIPKSENEARMKANITVRAVLLSTFKPRTDRVLPLTPLIYASV